MIIIWRGKGGLVFVAMLVGSFITQILFDFIPFLPDNQISYIFKGIVTAIVVAIFNWWLTERYVSTKVRVLIDEETQERILIKDGSHLFFIPNKYWTILILIFGILLTILSSTSQ